jgi:LmbE family N-acetylglucosaminyl deacetylase
MSRRFFYQVYKRLFPNWVKNPLERSIMELERFHPSRVDERPPGERVLVLAPHPDDETVGCGGTLRKYVDAGVHVKVVIMTDGRQGDPEIRRMAQDDPIRRHKEEGLVERRKREALAALDTLGVEDREFLEARDGELRASTAIVAPKLAHTLSQWRPDAVLLPFVTDRHRDHFATNGCFVEAIELLNSSWTVAIQCVAYEVWSPIYANVFVDISATMDFKRRALSCYQSQISEMDFAEGVEGLNRFRAISGMVGGDYAEAFFVAPLPNYRRLYRNLLL